MLKQLAKAASKQREIKLSKEIKLLTQTFNKEEM